MLAKFVSLFSLTKLSSLTSFNIDRLPAEGLDSLPDRLWPFMWFFLKQVKGLLITIAALELTVALSNSLVFWYLGVLVRQGSYEQAALLAGLALLLIRQLGGGILHGIVDLLYIPHFGNLVRRQLFWYIKSQSLTYFQNDFAGRIANKFLQSAPALRDVVGHTIGSVWFAIIFTVTNIWFMANASVWLALPLVVWLVCYALTLWHFIPKVQHRSAIHSECMSHLTGQVVDVMTNFLPAKYFAQTEAEDQRVVGLLRDHSKTFRAATRTIWQVSLIVDVLNTMLIFATVIVGFWLMETRGHDGVAAMAMGLGMALQATFQSGWIMREVSSIFENLGRVQEGVEALTAPHAVVDAPDARTLLLPVGGASIAYSGVDFHYGQEDARVMENFSLFIPPGQKVGVVGRSGAGKSTITSLLMRAYDVEGGEISISGQDISRVTQDSLRRQITVVTQESYLFHRSVLDNIRYGRPDASLEEVMAAAKAAHAHDFILGLSDSKGRLGYDAHVGERGVKLSGGQKQRIGIARAILKNSPILVLDEATSALDSESEHAIQTALETVMEGKTVIAIAHRLSTLRQMDRVIVMDAGKITDTILHWAEVSVAGLGKVAFINVMYWLQILLSFFVPSSSGLAVLSMPIMAPVADFAGVGRDLVVTAYQSANGIVNLINPTFAVVMGALAIGRIPYERWLRFMWPLLVILTVIIMASLSIAAIIV